MRFCHWFNIYGTANGSEGCPAGRSWRTPQRGNFLIENCLFEDLPGGSGGARKTRRSASSAARIPAACPAWCKLPTIQLRFGNSNQILG